MHCLRVFVCTSPKELLLGRLGKRIRQHPGAHGCAHAAMPDERWSDCHAKGSQAEDHRTRHASLPGTFTRGRISDVTTLQFLKATCTQHTPTHCSQRSLSIPLPDALHCRGITSSPAGRWAHFFCGRPLACASESDCSLPMVGAIPASECHVALRGRALTIFSVSSSARLPHGAPHERRTNECMWSARDGCGRIGPHVWAALRHAPRARARTARRRSRGASSR